MWRSLTSINLLFISKRWNCRLLCERYDANGKETASLILILLKSKILFFREEDIFIQHKNGNDVYL